MEEMLFGVEPFYVLTYVVAASIAGAGLGLKIIKLINKIDSRGRNQNKATVIISDHFDKQTDRLHPEGNGHPITPTVKTILEE